MTKGSGGSRFFRGVASLGALVVLVLAVFASLSPVARALRRGDPLTGAVLGTDLAEHAPHSDTLLVWIYRPSRNQVDIVSIPRDTKINLPGYRFRRINEVFAYHFAQKRGAHVAAEKVCEAVGHLFHKAGAVLTPTYYVQVDFEGFRRLVDRLGGVTLSVDEPMDYDDKAGNFHVHLATGLQHLQGEDSLGFVRYRGRSGDRGRILRQMEFVRALSKRLVSPEIVWRGPRAIWEVSKAVHTNLSFWDLLFLAAEARRLTSSGVNTVLLPGRPNGAAWEMDVERTTFVLERLSVGGGEEGLSVLDSFSSEEPTGGAGAPQEDLPRSHSGKSEAGPRVTVKVWNASGRSGLAFSVVRRLRVAGFDVVDWGNYNGRQNKSRVIDRSGRFDRARRVADVLGVGSLYSDVNPGLRTDVDVVLGDDFDSTDSRGGK
ncbi:MAG: LCP family protein [Elusimicrobia bacterium]|jgi:LCP family protein required for cell wall assembly|nr:LCP family protein [Elusimicrobiota bacterium]